MPIEEVLFFRRHSAVRLLTYNAVSAILRTVQPPMTGLGYTGAGRAGCAARCRAGSELTVLRTGLFRRPAYWLSMLIVVGFQILVDGWLTKLSAPIVVYDDRQTSGIRFPFDIPVEDFLFGFALVTAVLLLWERQRERR